MLPFRQLFSAISLALVLTHQQSSSPGSGKVFARPVQAINALESDTSISGSTSTEQATVSPEAVIKALKELSNGIEVQTTGDSQPVMVISHGDGGPILPGSSQDSEPSQDKKQNGKKTQGNKDKESKRPDNGKTGDESWKAANVLLEKPRSRFCAQAANTNTTIDEISHTLVKKERKRLDRIRQQRAAKSKSDSSEARTLTDARILADQAKTVQIVWHVIHAGQRGNLSEAMVDDQIQVLNDDYKAYGFQFNLNATNRVDNASFFRNMSPDTSLEDEMKTSLRRGDVKTLNLYSVDFQNGLLGYATFPWYASDYLSNDGVVFQYSSVPGGSDTGYNLGKTLTHEVGHWLGLYHVFQGGCAAPGDYVNDTPPQSTATNGCPVGQDSCPGGGPDSIHNYMDYSSDACLTEFTEGQAVRMAALTSQYRLI